MHLLFHIVYRAHATGTHHKLALDTLRHLKCTDADLWQRFFLANAKLYLDGSKAPDNEFKDFKNHVLHTRDGFWGGAPEKVRSWYHHLVEALSQKDWPTAAYCAGVLSHYYTDPLHPFHTQQSEAENNIHRACEWSISRSYDELRALGDVEFRSRDVDLSRDPNWLAQLVCDGAQMANVYYEKLIAHYDLSRGVVDPPAGLDRVGKRIVAELIRYAQVSYAAVLDRAIDEANVDPPEVSMTVATLAAVAQVPFKLLARRIANAEERRTVERMYDELVKTGTVQQNLPEDDRIVRDQHAREVLATRSQAEPSKVFPFIPRERVVTRIDQLRAGARQGPADVVALRPKPDVAEPAAKPALKIVEQVSRPAASTADEEIEMATADERAAERPRSGLTERLDQLTVAPLVPRETRSRAAQPAAAAAGGGFNLTLDHEVVDGPSVGPKTAERLQPHGIKTVKDLLKADPVALAVMVNARHITPEAITDWQDQARLMCSVPGLRATHVQLLVGAGYRSADAIAEADADKLCADVLALAASPTGQRLLRSGDPPDIARIKGWVDAARSIKAA